MYSQQEASWTSSFRFIRKESHKRKIEKQDNNRTFYKYVVSEWKCRLLVARRPVFLSFFWSSLFAPLQVSTRGIYRASNSLFRKMQRQMCQPFQFSHKCKWNGYRITTLFLPSSAPKTLAIGGAKLNNLVILHKELHRAWTACW